MDWRLFEDCIVWLCSQLIMTRLIEAVIAHVKHYSTGPLVISHPCILSLIWMVTVEFFIGRMIGYRLLLFLQEYIQCAVVHAWDHVLKLSVCRTMSAAAHYQSLLFWILIIIGVETLWRLLFILIYNYVSEVSNSRGIYSVSCQYKISQLFCKLCLYKVLFILIIFHQMSALWLL